MVPLSPSINRRKFVKQNLFSTAQVFEEQVAHATMAKADSKSTYYKTGLDVAGFVLILASTFSYANTNLQFHFPAA